MTNAPVKARVSREDTRLVNAFVAFALNPGASTAGVLPFSPHGVSLGLGQHLIQDLPRGDEEDPAPWQITTQTAFRGYVGPFSALRTVSRHVQATSGDSDVRKSGDISISVGPHRHCASPPVPAPKGLADLRRVSLQPADDSITSCLAWFSVDMFLDADRNIAAVTLDLWEP